MIRQSLVGSLDSTTLWPLYLLNNSHNMLFKLCPADIIYTL